MHLEVTRARATRRIGDFLQKERAEQSALQSRSFNPRLVNDPVFKDILTKPQ
jgi:hypothetical protein